jgi:hypothetical protein
MVGNSESWKPVADVAVRHGDGSGVPSAGTSEVEKKPT